MLGAGEQEPSHMPVDLRGRNTGRQRKMPETPAYTRSQLSQHATDLREVVDGQNLNRIVVNTL